MKNLILKKEGGWTRTRQIWFKIGTSGRLLRTRSNRSNPLEDMECSFKNDEAVPAATATYIQLQHYNIWLFPIQN